jgi:predicted acyltransferase
MLLMIWVNDFWTLTDIPKWLKHARGSEDYLGFSDIIFPLFLFLVGLSIPYTIERRKKKGNSNVSIAKHIFIRFLSLLLIGVYMVNFETAHHESILIGKCFWEILMAIAVMLIWMYWKRSPIPEKWHRIFQLVGFLILIYLAMIYKGGADGTMSMKIQWWGILGLIGWAYGFNALVFLFSKGRLVFMTSIYIILNLLVLLSHTDLLPKLPASLKYLSIIYSGSIPAFTTAGILTTLLFKKLQSGTLNRIPIVLTGIGILHIIYGILLRSYWGISKSQGTPSWLAICIGIGIISFVVLYVLFDLKGKKDWAKIIAPAGTATLMCYLILYLAYPIGQLTGIKLPQILNTGIIGLIGSMIFSLLIVVLVGWFEKKGYKLKL